MIHELGMDKHWRQIRLAAGKQSNQHVLNVLPNGVRVHHRGNRKRTSVSAGIARSR